MGDLTSKFTREDIETLIEAMGDWEALGNHEFHIMSMIKSAPMPPEEHEAFEAWSQIKEHFRNRERDIMASRAVRQEKAVFVKAKLMMVRRDLGIETLFDMASNADAASPAPQPKPIPQFDNEGWFPKKTKAVSEDEEGFKAKLELAEFFIRDLGVQNHYEKFLAERKNGGQELSQS
jgi:hypothetical protein